MRGHARSRGCRRAEANASLALGALDSMFSRFAPATIGSVSQAPIGPTVGEAMELPSAPVFSVGAATLLQEMLPLCDRLTSETGNERQVRGRAVASR